MHIVSFFIRIQFSTKKTFKEIIEKELTTLISINIGHCMIRFEFSNFLLNIECNVFLKKAFMSQITKEKSF